MATRREYKGNAAATTLSAAISSSAVTATLSDSGVAANWPTGPSFAVIDRGTASEESVSFTRSGVTLTLTRAQNDTTAVSHGVGASIEHVWTKTDADESNAHVSDAETDPHAAKLLNNTRHDDAVRHAIGTVIAAGTSVSTSAPGHAAAPGTAAALSRSDHVHGREPYGAVGNVAASAPGDTAAAGTVDAVARVDHRHAREAPGSGGTPITYGTPGTSAVGDTAAAGAASTVARSDHRHARENFGNVAPQTIFGIGASNGSAATIARSDHAHGTPTFAPVSIQNTSSGTTTSTSYAAVTGSISFSTTVGSSGRLAITVAAGQVNSGAFITSTTFALSGGNTRAGVDAEAIQVGGTNYSQHARTIYVTGLTPSSTTIATVSRVTGGTGTVSNQELTVIPI